jgi:hypothetical protein
LRANFNSLLTQVTASMSTYRTLDDVDVTGQAVLVRVDLNVPVKGGKVTDVTRIERILRKRPANPC